MRTAREASTFLAHLMARDSARFIEVLARTHPEARVPTCPDWDADDLLWHLAEVQWFWGMIASRGRTALEDVEALDSGGHPGRPSERDDLLAFFLRASADLQHSLNAVSPDTPAWTWSDAQSVGFIRRRQAHEALIHRLDAELTAGDRSPMDVDLSTDGVDEALHIMYGGLPPWGQFAPDPTQTIRVETIDTHRSWLVTLGRFTGTDPDGTGHDENALAVTSSASTPSAVASSAVASSAVASSAVASSDDPSDTDLPSAANVRGAAADLDCWLWHRPAMGVIDRGGDVLVLARLDQTIAEGIS
jgi:uncharacterized protein (TIGR03083 family)